MDGSDCVTLCEDTDDDYEIGKSCGGSLEEVGNKESDGNIKNKYESI